MNPNDYIRNMNAKTPEELAPYAGKYVAVSEDGTIFLAAGGSLEELFAEVKRLGVTEYVSDYIPTEAEIMGGFR